MSQPLMPKATAVWLIENTTLTFRQIAAFTGLHELEIQAMADGDIATGMKGIDPIANSQLTEDEIKRCEADKTATLQLKRSTLPKPKARSKGPRYVPVSKRGDKPDGIAWLVKNHPELSDAQVGKLAGTTKATIQKIRDRSHWNIQNIKARHPVELGICTMQELDAAVAKARKDKPASQFAAADAAIEV